MISKTLDEIQKDLDFIKAIANEEYFKKVEEQCEFVNTRNKVLQDRIDKAIKELEEDGVIVKQYKSGYGEIEMKDYLLDILKGDDK